MNAWNASDRAWLLEHVRCPVCRAGVSGVPGGWTCRSAAETHVFPVVEGRPVLINEQNSIFRISDFVEHRFVMGARSSPHRAKGWILGLIPATGENRAGARMLERMRNRLLESTVSPIVLVVGGGTAGEGMSLLIEDPAIRLVETDVSLAERTQVICDGHDLPFVDDSFDGVVIQAVLEHVADPPRVVSEIWRVLKPGGLVYAETPFMQQVHNRAYDFTRYTHLGHRRLFRWFEEIESGPIGGPGVALSWSLDYFLRSLSTHRRVLAAATLLNRLATFWLKYVDRWIGHRPQVYNAGWAYYFLGRAAPTPISDRELLRLYRGALD